MVVIEGVGGIARWPGAAFITAPALEAILEGGATTVTIRKPRSMTDVKHYQRIGKLKRPAEVIVYYVDPMNRWSEHAVVAVCEVGLRAAFRRIPLNIYVKKEA